jgi:hypothetical protein
MMSLLSFIRQENTPHNLRGYKLREVDHFKSTQLLRALPVKFHSGFAWD